MAVDEGRVQLALTLIKHGVNVNSTQVAKLAGDTPLHVAARRGLVQLVEPLLDAGADSDATKEQGPRDPSAHSGCMWPPGHCPSAHQAWGRPKWQNRGGSVPRLHTSSMHGPQACAPLGQAGLYAPLFYAMRNGHTSIVQELLAAGADLVPTMKQLDAVS